MISTWRTNREFYHNYITHDDPTTTCIDLSSVLNRPMLRDENNFIRIPDRNALHRDCATVHPNDPAIYKPASEHLLEQPSSITPEFFPLTLLPYSIDTHKNPKNNHIKTLVDRFKLLTPFKILATLTGIAPALWCEDKQGAGGCKKCNLAKSLYYVGREIILPGGWGVGKIDSIARLETTHVVFVVTGQHVHTEGRSARIRVPIDFTRLPYWTRTFHIIANILELIPMPPSPLPYVITSPSETVPVNGKRPLSKHITQS